MNVQPTNDQVDQIFERYGPASPGCALAVMQDGQIVYKQSYGLANLEHNAPILPSTVFNIGSMAKQFTAFAIALLQDESKLSFDNDLRQYLPEMHDFGRPIAIRCLIHHTSGLRGSFPKLLALAEWRDADAFSDDWLPIMGYPTTYLVVFERDACDAIAGLRVSGNRVQNLRFIRQST